MKTFILFLSFLAISSTAFADQTIECHELNPSGSIKAKGIKLNLIMTTKKTGTVVVTGLKSLETMNINGSNEGTGLYTHKDYTTLFMTPTSEDHMLDIQLQFDAKILRKEFSNLRADFVIGSEDANPETGFSFGFVMACSGQIN